MKGHANLDLGSCLRCLRYDKSYGEKAQRPVEESTHSFAGTLAVGTCAPVSGSNGKERGHLALVHRDPRSQRLAAFHPSWVLLGSLEVLLGRRPQGAFAEP